VAAVVVIAWLLVVFVMLTAGSGCDTHMMHCLCRYGFVQINLNIHNGYNATVMSQLRVDA